MAAASDRVNWGVVGTGGITRRFAAGLGAVTGARLAAAASRSMDTARAFAAEFGAGAAYDRLEGMLEDGGVDVVYIGTPHVFHREMAVKALRAGKGVLVEKPAAMSAGELDEMLAAARASGKFFMEAMWTRFTPALALVREWLAEGRVGEPRMVEADFGFNAAFNPANRLFNRALGGGCLLDAGVYPLSFASMVFGGERPGDVRARVVMGETGVDEAVMAVLGYGGGRMAYAATALRTGLTNDAWVYGARGKIHVPNFVFAREARLLVDGAEVVVGGREFAGNGYNYEAEEVGRCLRAGLVESPVMGWGESRVVMETMDRIRGAGGA